MKSEAEIIAAAKAGDRRAFMTLVAGHQERVYALACRMTGDRAAAEDLAQDAFLRAFQNLAEFEQRSSFFTWLYRIVMNLCLRHMERQKALTFAAWPPLPEEQAGPEPVLDPEQALLREEVKVGCLTGLVRCLPSEQRSAFVLATLLGLSDRDVAAVLECSVDAVKARLTRARDALARFLERRCQWIDEQNACRCHRYIASSLAKGLISGRDLAVGAEAVSRAHQALAEVGQIREVISLYTRLPSPRAAEGLVVRIQQGIEAGEWPVLR